jgi:hypothetical protein
MNAQALIETLRLQPLPGEGGFYRETYRSSERVAATALPERYRADKEFGTAIYYLLTPETTSALHRLPTDEVFHFYLGDPVLMLQLFPGGAGERIILGPDVLSGQVVQCVVPKFVWQGATLVAGGGFALMGTTMAPAFDFADFELGNRAELLAQYREHAELINRLTSE